MSARAKKVVRRDGSSSLTSHDHAAMIDLVLQWLARREDDSELSLRLQSQIDDLMQITLDRAINGWFEPIYHDGEECGRVRKFDHELSFMMLQQLRPEIYGDHEADDISDVALELVPMETLSDTRANLSLITRAMGRREISIEFSLSLLDGVDRQRQAIVDDTLTKDVAALKAMAARKNED